MVWQSVAERANKYLNERDQALAKLMGQEVGKVLAKAFKRK